MYPYDFPLQEGVRIPGMKGVSIDEIHICNFRCSACCIYGSELFTMVAVAFVAVVIALDL